MVAVVLLAENLLPARFELSEPRCLSAPAHGSLAPVVGAECEPGDPPGGRAGGGQHQDHRGIVRVGDHAAERVAVQAGEVAVEHDYVVGVEVEPGGAGKPVISDVDGHALVAEALGDQVRELRLVLDDKNPHADRGFAAAGVAAGSVICTRSPPCGRAWSSSAPPCASATAATIDSPNDAVCDGAWGKLAARIGEKVRRAIDLEHWAACQDSFHRLVRTLEELASGRRGRPPASIVLLGGDIHQAYVAEVAFRDAAGAKSHVYQAVCSPFRHPLSKRERTAFRVAQRSRALRWLTQRMAHSAGVRDPTVRWRALQEPTFDNQVAWVRLDGRQLSLTIERVRPGDGPELEATFERRLA